jgi:predicted Zn finger-like uncharacterized protein
MATLIICPACGTRYETKAVFPPEGRKVRCSKCAHVWQAQPVTPPPSPAVEARQPQQAPQPSPAPQMPPPPAAPNVNAAMRGFAGIAPAPPPPVRPGQASPAESDLAAQVARINAEISAAAGHMPEPAKPDGIFARLSAKGDSALGTDAAMDEGPFAGAAIGDAGMGDAEMAVDPALAAQAFPEEKPARRKLPIVAMGWLVLALIVAGVIGTLALAPSAVMKVLPGAARLYALVGMPVGAQGLAFEGVRYGWTTEGGQTVLEVQGDVVNNTSGPLDVPTLVIALRDENGEEISEWTTEIGEDALGAGEHAPFLRQIPSPPSNVRSVKVGFAKAE